MGQPIMISMSDILLLAGAIVTISVAVKVVCEAIERIRKPNKTQDARITELESKSVKDFNRLNKLEEGNIVTQRALLALLAHGIDGNDIEAMRKAKAELTDYLIERYDRLKCHYSASNGFKSVNLITYH